MRYLFSDCELDLGRQILRRDGETIAVEPQVFSLLVILAQNPDRLITRAELFEQLWPNQEITDTTLSGRIRDARRALGDDGQQQRLIRTVHRRGYRFTTVVDSVEESPARRTIEVIDLPPPHAPQLQNQEQASTAPSLAIVPLKPLAAEQPLCEAITHDLIQTLSRLRWLRVIARESSFAPRAADRLQQSILGLPPVRYLLRGTLERRDKTLIAGVELLDSQDSSIVWVDRFECTQDDIHPLRQRIADDTAVALELHIAEHEARRARLSVSEHLDAWAHYHLGLSHALRFNADDNQLALAQFTRATELDPQFSRAWSGLSFTYLQRAFVQRERSSAVVASAVDSAERAAALDRRDPFAALVMGRVSWLQNDLESGLGWLDDALALCPNYAQASYSRSLTALMLNREADAVQTGVDRAIGLSPLDPLRYGMFCLRGMALAQQGDTEAAARWCERGARLSGEVAIIPMLAVAALHDNGEHQRAATWAERSRAMSPGIGIDDLFSLLPFQAAPYSDSLRRNLGKYGFLQGFSGRSSPSASSNDAQASGLPPQQSCSRYSINERMPGIAARYSTRRPSRCCSIRPARVSAARYTEQVFCFKSRACATSPAGTRDG